MSDLLFHEHNLRAVIEGHERKMLEQIDGLPENRLLNSAIEDLCKFFVGEYTIEVPKLDQAGIQADYGDAKIDVSRRYEYATRDDERPTYVKGTRLSFYVPFAGDAELFKCQPSTFNYNPPRAEIAKSELIFTFERTASEAEKIDTEFKNQLSGTMKYLDWIERDIAPFNQSVDCPGWRNVHHFTGG